MNWSNCTITLSNSALFFRLSLVLHAFALYMLYDLALLWPVKLIIGLGLLLLFIWISLRQSTILNLKQLSFFDDKWTVYEHNHPSQCYEKHRIMLELGIFFLIEFSSERQRKTVVIFFDQLSAEDYRLLHLMERFS